MNVMLFAQSLSAEGRGLYIGMSSVGCVLILVGLILIISAWISRGKADTPKDFGKGCTFNVPSPPVIMSRFGAYASSLLGDRTNQQDSYRCSGVPSIKADVVAVVCDGMGGLENGEITSKVCADIVFDGLCHVNLCENIENRMKELIHCAEQKTTSIIGPDGRSVHGGTTVVAALVRGNTLFWASVGDSRIYLYREGTVTQLTRDHNYRLQLMEEYRAGKIRMEQIEQHPKKEALISYVGGGLRMIDTGSITFSHVSGDILILCSDGLYKTMSEQDIAETVEKFVGREEKLAEALASAAVNKGMVKHDNTTVVVIGGK